MALEPSDGAESVEHSRVTFSSSSTMTFCGLFVMLANDSEITYNMQQQQQHTDFLQLLIRNVNKYTLPKKSKSLDIVQ